jgi:stage V sporulation protein G
MNITKVSVNKLENNKILALASIKINDEFVVGGLKVLQGQNGLWVAMPNYKKGNGEYQDIAYPVTADARETIQKAVLEKYSEIDYKESERVQPVVEDVSTAHQKREQALNDVISDDLPF